MGEKKIYLIYAEKIDAYKIGISKNPAKRIKNLQTGCPYELSLLNVFKSNFPHQLEKAIHKKYLSYKKNIDQDEISGEWFNLPFNCVVNFLEECESIENNFRILKEAGNPFV